MTDHNPINDWYVEWACTLDSAGSDSTAVVERLQSGHTLGTMMDTLLRGIQTARHVDALKKHLFYGRDLNKVEEYSPFDLGLTIPGTWERACNHETIRLMHAILGLYDEAGELMQTLFEHLFFGKPLDPINLTEEFGDTLWYMALGARYFQQTTFAYFMLGNYGKLVQRYPEGAWTQDRALNRDKDAEMLALKEGTDG